MMAMKKGWVLFGTYCRLRGIKQDGNHSRRLAKLDPSFKENLTPDNLRATWAVNIVEANKLFKGGE